MGYNHWEELLEKINGHPDPFAKRILNLSSHSVHAGDEISYMEDGDKEKLIKLVKFLTKTYGFKEKEKHND